MTWRKRNAVRPRAWAQLAWLLCGAQGCEVGQPVVDEIELPNAQSPVLPQCNPPPSCAAPADETLDVPFPLVQPESFAACPGGVPWSGTSCGTGSADAGVSDAGTADLDDDAGTAPSPPGLFQPESCLPDIELGTSLAAAEASVLQCSTRQLRAPRAADTTAASAITLEAVHWESSNIRIVADAPLSLSLEGAELSSVHITLEGPVTLRVKDSVRVQDVRVVAVMVDENATSTSPVTIELDHVDAEGLVIGGDAQLFPGDVDVQRSTLTASTLRARRVNLEAVTWSGGQLQSFDSSIADVLAKGLRLDFSRALISASRIEGSKIAHCDALRMIATQVQYSDTAACSEAPLRAYDTRVIGGRIDGRIEGDNLGFEGALLGVNEPFDLVLWRGSMQNVTFCAHTGKLEVLALDVACSECDEGVFVTSPAEICLLSTAFQIGGTNFCEALNEAKANALECAPPHPERLRPHESL